MYTLLVYFHQFLACLLYPFLIAELDCVETVKNSDGISVVHNVGRWSFLPGQLHHLSATLQEKVMTVAMTLRFL